MATKYSTFSLILFAVGVLLTLALLTRTAFVLVAPRSIVTGRILAVHDEKNDITGGPKTRRVQYTFTRPNGGSLGEVQVLASALPAPAAGQPIRILITKLGPFWRFDVTDFGLRPDFNYAAAFPPLAGVFIIWSPMLGQWIRRRRQPASSPPSPTSC